MSKSLCKSNMEKRSILINKENEKVGRKTSAAAFGKQKNTEGKQKTRDAAIEAHDDEPSFVES